MTQTDAQASASAQAYTEKVQAEQAAAAERTRYRPIPKGSTVLIIGDSYSQGHGAEDKKSQGFAYVLGRSMGWNTKVDGIGRTGFFSGGGIDRKDPNTYNERVIRTAADKSFQPALVIFQGSQNDFPASSSELLDAMKAAAESSRKAWPKAQIVVLGTMAPEPNGARLAPMNSTLRRGADVIGAPFIDILANRWLTRENSPKYAFKDGWHVNTAGHVYLASKIKETLDAK